MNSLILAIDDDSATLRIVRLALESVGRRVIGVESAALALDTLADARPDIIISDVRMPGMDGVQLCEQLKKEPRFADIPVLLMSAHAEPPKHSADAFLPKPFELEALVDAVAGLSRR